jgi:hypothetical protein
MKKKYVYIFLVALCFLVYANSLPNQFVSDDVADIVENKDLGDTARYLMFPHNTLNSLVYRATKTNPVPYHAVSILAHSVMTILVFVFLSLFFRQRASLLGAALFAVHPIHAEAVTWISGRPYVLVGLFTLGTLLLYYRATRQLGSIQPQGLTAVQPQRPDSVQTVYIRWYLGALAVFSYFIYRNFAFYFVFPVLLVIFDATFQRIRRTWKWIVPFFIILVLRLYMSKMDIAGRAVSVSKEMEGGFQWTNPLFNMVYSLFSHLGLLFWPAELSLYHEPPIITIFWLRMGLLALVFGAVVLTIIYERARPVFFGILLFALFLAPTYSPVTISWLLAERYVYTPSIMLSIIMAFAYQSLFSRKRMKGIGLALCSFIIAGYAARTVVRNEDWRTPEKLWRATVEVSPESPRAHNNMGDVYAKEGNYEKAIEEFKRAIALKPHYADPYHNAGNIYEVTGRYQEAVAYYEQAIARNPELVITYRHLAHIYQLAGDTARSNEYLARAAQVQEQKKVSADNMPAQAGVAIAAE